MTLVVDPDTSSTAGSTFVMPGQDDPWVLETFPQRTVTERTISPPDPSLAPTVFRYRELYGHGRRYLLGLPYDHIPVWVESKKAFVDTGAAAAPIRRAQAEAEGNAGQQ